MAGKGQRMTLRTFEEGMPFPPMKPDTLRLYSMRFCPYAQRARLVLAHKNIPYETVNVHLKRKPSWLLERNPKGRVPVLEHPDGRIVFESIIVCQYLDEIFPEDCLTPQDPYQKACDRVLVDYCDKFMMAWYQLLFTDGESEEGKATIEAGLHMYDQELEKRQKGPFFGGSKPVMLDYLIWPWFERLTMFDDYTSLSSHPDERITSTVPEDISGRPVVVATKYPRVFRWMASMFELPAVRDTMFDLMSHRRFGRSQLTADPEYDMGLDDEPPLPHLAKL
ncbi:hypothetical protein BaRGS_00009904 [Batillaria attramentaria]|uniref:Glutathione S-transferase omega n=1 Tax=Batillaria attramentaria TaxID=370345 RepID=A0ABD0LH08_9CAEN